MPRARTAVLGGTFDRLHVGHAALLDAAVRSAEVVRIGLTTERYLAAHPKPLGPRIRPFAARRRALRRFLTRTYPGRPFEIVPLDDGVGRAAEPGVDVLVVSAETLEGAKAVNRLRRERHLPPVRLVVVPHVFATDLRAVTSRRIRAGQLTSNGRRVGPLLVEL
ncbi:MAG: pantetheine-phosphate adenylyltransferase, partial [Thermoplasmata archaeon]|nr:pantetheine-phosphate adenylyltransferase [Thermoplasmata archaeon]